MGQVQWSTERYSLHKSEVQPLNGFRQKYRNVQLAQVRITSYNLVTALGIMHTSAYVYVFGTPHHSFRVETHPQL